MKYLFNCLLAFTLLFSCGTDKEKNIDTSPVLENKTNTTTNNTTKAPDNNNPATQRQVIDSDTYGGQIVRLSRIYLKYSNNARSKTDEIRSALTKVTHKDLAKVKDFVFESTQKSDKLLSKRFLQKPSKEELISFYKLRFINWNSMSREPLSEKVLEQLDITTVTYDNMLTAYYRLLMFPLVTNMKIPDTYQKIDINPNQLRLKNEKERGIFFYSIAEKFAIKYNQLVRRNNIGCNEAKKVIQTFPTFNGQNLFEVKLYQFEEFNFTLSNNYSSVGFLKHQEAIYNKARLEHEKCK